MVALDATGHKNVYKCQCVILNQISINLCFLVVFLQPGCEGDGFSSGYIVVVVRAVSASEPTWYVIEGVVWPLGKLGKTVWGGGTRPRTIRTGTGRTTRIRALRFRGCTLQRQQRNKQKSFFVVLGHTQDIE